MFSTNDNRKNVPVYESADLKNWVSKGDAMPRLPKWARKGFTWAPEIIQFRGIYWLFYTARAEKTTLPCIGLATSDRPEGPYTSEDEDPFLCMDSEGGAIDASPYVENDIVYLTWKANGNRLRKQTRIMAATVDLTARSLSSSPVTLIANDAPWEGISIEAPSLIKHLDKYYLFYSGAMFNTRNYAVGYATSESIFGPYEKYGNNPIIESTWERWGTGHQTIFLDKAGNYWIAYHAYPGSIRGRKRTTQFERLIPSAGKASTDPEVHWRAVPPTNRRASR
jgi:beta-xylosidase